MSEEAKQDDYMGDEQFRQTPQEASQIAKAFRELQSQPSNEPIDLAKEDDGRD